MAGMTRLATASRSSYGCCGPAIAQARRNLPSFKNSAALPGPGEPSA